jgi:carbamoyl-phosphate synthase small subunit
VNHPVINYETSRIEITPQNHGFACSDEGLPSHIIVTHRSLFDGVIEGVQIEEGAIFNGFEIGKIFAVQYHPEGSGGPHDSKYLFDKFISLL